MAQDPRPLYVITRRVSIYLTWLLLHTNLRPNQVTALTVFLGVLASVLLAFPGGWWALAAGLVFTAHHLVDKVDGDIARFRRIYSIVGVYLDEVGHGLAFGGICIGLGLHLSWNSEPAGQIAIMTAAAVCGMAMVMARHHKNVGFQLYAQHVMTRPHMLPPVAASGPAALSRAATQEARRAGRSAGPMALARDVALQLSDFAVMVILILIGAVIEIATGSRTFLRWTLFGETALQGAILLALVAANVSVSVESEVRRLHQTPRASEPPSAPHS